MAAPDAERTAVPDMLVPVPLLDGVEARPRTRMDRRLPFLNDRSTTSIGAFGRPGQPPGVKVAIALATSTMRIVTEIVAWNMFTYFARAERTSATPPWKPRLITNAVCR